MRVLAEIELHEESCCINYSTFPISVRFNFPNAAFFFGTNRAIMEAIFGHYEGVVPLTGKGNADYKGVLKCCLGKKYWALLPEH